MNTWRNRFALWLLFLATGNIFDMFASDLPSGALFALIYYGCAATVDLLMFRVTRYFASGKVQRDVEDICFASIATNALGWALYQTKSPPTFYNGVIAGLNYVLAFRLLFGGGNVIDWINHSYRRIVVLCNHFGYSDHSAKKEKR